MTINSDQCRAARSLVNWSQGELATNAVVSRATVADFEANARRPMKNNLRSIEDCLFSAGVEFIPEEGTKGVGVRFRERKLEYISNVRIDLLDRIATLRMRYAGQDFSCVLDLDAVDDFHAHPSSFDGEKAYTEAVSKMFHTILATAEKYAATHIREGRLLITLDMMERR